jgi:tetratricopeptide (TPR) repeat protein
MSLRYELCSDDRTSRYRVKRTELVYVLNGVIEAARGPITEAPDLKAYTPSGDEFEVGEWLDYTLAGDKPDEIIRQLLLIALGISILRAESRGAIVTDTKHVAIAWNFIHTALASPCLDSSFRSSRSAQGFLAVPLCSIIRDGDIKELFRLHVWLPADRQRSNVETSIHSHQSFGHSWVLAGEITNRTYAVARDPDRSAATHAEYALTWVSGEHAGSKYQTHQTSSYIENTGTLVRAELQHSATFTRHLNYTVAAGVYHSSSARPDKFHATLFFFDSGQGFFKDARVLGPCDLRGSEQLRDFETVKPTILADQVHLLRSWEENMIAAEDHAKSARWEDGLKSLEEALLTCATAIFPSGTFYTQITQGKLGEIYRRFGRYVPAQRLLRSATEQMPDCIEKSDLEGELGVIYRHMDMLEEAKTAFQDQYKVAITSGYARAACRAIGNLGVMNYLISMRNGNDTLLDTAISQLEERVEQAHHLQNKIWEVIGLSRLCSCYILRRDINQALEYGSKALLLSSDLQDPSVVSWTSMQYGRALHMAGRKEEAMRLFDPEHGCTPAIGLCKSPSREHRQLVEELLSVGVKMDKSDELGYTALDYAVFSEDKKMEAIVLQGLRQQFNDTDEGRILEMQYQSRLRKGYREIFQGRLRPVLISTIGNKLHELRKGYAQARKDNLLLKEHFDGLVYVPYTDFINFGRIPRAGEFVPESFENGNTSANAQNNEFVVFFSYRWQEASAGRVTPDDRHGTQYRRMIDALEQFLRLRPDIRKTDLRIWLVSKFS